jgi:Fe(3+) dicitrate transport protein
MAQGLLVAAGEESTTLDSLATAQALAAHLHEDLSMGRLHLFPGVRVEVVRTSREDQGEDSAAPQIRATPLPGAGVLFEATPSLDLFAGAHRGFSPVAPGQPEEVLPEQSRNYEAGLRFGRSLAHAELVAFYNDYTNITGQCTYSAGCTGELLDVQFNGGAAQILGAEAVVGAELPAGDRFILPISASYAWTQSAFTTSFNSNFSQYGEVQAGDFLPYVAAHQAHLTVGLEHSRWSLNVGVSYRSAMLDQAGGLSEADIPGLLLVDAAAHLSLAEDWEVYATGTNLTSETAITSWRPFGARPTAPLQIMAGLKWSPVAD